MFLQDLPTHQKLLPLLYSAISFLLLELFPLPGFVTQLRSLQAALRLPPPCSSVLMGPRRGYTQVLRINKIVKKKKQLKFRKRKKARRKKTRNPSNYLTVSCRRVKVRKIALISWLPSSNYTAVLLRAISFK